MYTSLIDNLTKRLKLDLPSALAHDPLRAVPVGPIIPKFKTGSELRVGSVLILLYEEDGQLKFPLIKRPDYPGAHGGQISLPGGKKEPGEDSIQTALREAQEEIGVGSQGVNIIGRLSEFHVIPSNFMITPVVASIHEVPEFMPDSYEVERIITGNISDLIRDDAVLTKEILAAGTYKMMAPHFEIGGEIVWGATAMMLNEFRLILREIF
jgi:8-oxo-dGTP pyrophosphatase MutT (NUDIX family)